MGKDYTKEMRDKRIFGVPRLRDQVSKLLTDAYTHNYIDTDDYEKRLELVQSAKNRGDIFIVIADFPDSMKDTYIFDEPLQEDSTERPYNQSSQSNTSAHSHDPHRYESIFSSNKVSLHEIYGNKVSCYALFGELTVDLTHLRPYDELHLYCKATFGEIKIFVPENTQVINHCQTLFGDVQIKINPHKAQGPTIHLHGMVLFGSVNIRDPKRFNKLKQVVSSIFYDLKN